MYGVLIIEITSVHSELYNCLVLKMAVSNDSLKKREHWYVNDGLFKGECIGGII